MRNFKYAGRMALVVSAMAASSAVYAQTTAPSRPATEAKSASWLPYTSSGYFGASVGRTDYDSSVCISLSCDDSATGFKVYTGGRFSRYFGAELGYFNLGKADRNAGHIKAQGANLSLIGYLPLSESFSLLGKVGGNYGWTKTSSTIPNVPSGKADDFGLSYGAGLQFDINRSVAIRADWDRYRLKYVAGRDDADLLSVGVLFKF